MIKRLFQSSQGKKIKAYDDKLGESFEMKIKQYSLYDTIEYIPSKEFYV